MRHIMCLPTASVPNTFVPNPLPAPLIDSHLHPLHGQLQWHLHSYSSALSFHCCVNAFHSIIPTTATSLFEGACSEHIHRVRKDHFKGMSEAEKQAVLATQLAQVEERKAKQAAEVCVPVCSGEVHVCALGPVCALVRVQAGDCINLTSSVRRGKDWEEFKGHAHSCSPVVRSHTKY